MEEHNDVSVSQPPIEQPVVTPDPQQIKPKKYLPLLVIILLFLVGIGYYLFKIYPTKPITPQASHTTESKKQEEVKNVNFATLMPTTKVTKGTIDYAQDTQQVYLRYQNTITIPDNSQYKTIPTNLVWHPILQEPSTDGQNHRSVFSFQESNNSVFDFMFVMEWDMTHYDLYMHKKNNIVEKLASFDITNKANNGYNVPKINQISPDGNYIALDMYGCWYCESGQPNVLLMNISSKKTEKIGQVAYFNWKNNGTYDYKEYVTKACPTALPGNVNYTDICPEDPQNIPMKSGQFL